MNGKLLAVAASVVLAVVVVLGLPAGARAQRRGLLPGRRVGGVVPRGTVYVPTPVYVPAGPYAPSPGPAASAPPGGPAPDSGPPADSNAGVVQVRLPNPDAELWVDGEKVTDTGTSRRVVSPTLKPRESVTYELRARWSQDGNPVAETQKVTVYAGDRVTVDFGARPRPESPPEIVPREYREPGR